MKPFYERRASISIPRANEIVSDYKLQSGVYTVLENRDNSLSIMPSDFKTEALVDLKSSVAHDILKKVDKFFSAETKARYAKHKMLHKRGLLMYGEPGTGKSSIIGQAVQNILQKHDAIIFKGIHSVYLVDAVKQIREIEETVRPVVCIWEEFENVVNMQERHLLGLLDGESVIEEIFYIATTNHIDQIPNRIKNRPSRFANVICVDKLSPAAREAYIRAKLHPEDRVNVNKMVQLTEGMVIDQLKDVIISTCVFELELEDAVEKVKQAGSIESQEEE